MRNVLITGGSRGIGRAIAESFLREGDAVLIVSRNQNELEAAQHELLEISKKIYIHCADVSRIESVRTIGAAVAEKLSGRIDVLINAAGIMGPIGKVENLSDDEMSHWTDPYMVNALGTALVCRMAIPFMKGAGGHVITFSGGGEGAWPHMSAYVSSKASIWRFTETFAAEVREYSVSVNMIAPGEVNTQFLQWVLDAGPEKAGKMNYEKALKQKESGGTGPQGAVRLIHFLVSKKAEGITGRFFAAKWDNLDVIAEHKDEIINSDIFRIIRVKPEDRGKDWESAQTSVVDKGRAGPRTIGVVGLWHLGETFSVGLAELGHRVIAYDKNPEVIENFRNGIPPIAEPRIGELLKKNLAEKRISFVSELGAFKDVDIVWITFDTPVNENDEPDTSVIFEAVRECAPFLKKGSLVAITSQVPVGTSRTIKELLHTLRPEAEIDVAYVPENLQLGNAAHIFFHPDRIVIGSDNLQTREIIKDVFKDTNTQFLCMGLESAEVSKHALNAFLATSLSFINDIADICEISGADILEVVKGLKADSRIGPGAYLGAGLGFAGGTLGRDLTALLDLAQKYNIELPVIEATFRKNKVRRMRIPRVLDEILGGVRDKNIAVLGLTYKAGTPTLRRSAALEIIKNLKENGARLKAHDPMASPAEVREQGIEFFADPYDAVEGCEAVLIITDWPQFQSIDFKKIKSLMGTSHPWIVDAKNFFVVKEQELKALGFRYRGIGRR